MRKFLALAAALLLATSAQAQVYNQASPIGGNGGPPAAGAAGTVDVNGHFLLGKQSTPTITSGACGTTTNGVITSGSDQSFIVTIGSATTTSCAINFGSTWTTKPRSCVFAAASAGSAAVTVLPHIDPTNITTTGVTLSGAVLASTVWNIQCQ
jgi:hypothetical protein